jgi:ABC-type Fe3+-hydroxamate transport system substrate-binding protein
MLFTDQLNNSIELKHFPKRIVSLVPSQTELLWDLGLKEEIVGITKFCIHPTQLYNAALKIGGTKNIDIEKIRSLKPDIIIGNKEENEKVQIEALQAEFPVWMSDIYNLNDSLTMIDSLGKLTNKGNEAAEIIDNINNSFLKLVPLNSTVLYLIWKKPFMAAGKATFIGDMLQKIGLKNVISDSQSRYPELNINEIKELNPELVFLSTEPFPFNQTHISELRNELPNSKIILVDGELFSWYGSRLQKSADYFNELL